MPNARSSGSRLQVRGWRTRAIGAAALVAVFSACSRSPGSQSTPPGPTEGSALGATLGSVASTVAATSVAGTGGSASRDKTPSDLLFERVVGMPLEQVDQRVLAARAAKQAECLAGRGFSRPPTTSSQAFTESPPTYGGYPDYVIRRIDAERAAGLVPAPRPSLAEEQAQAECDQAANQSVPDPIGVYAAWLDNVGTEVADRARADPRATEAMRRFDECLAESGHDLSTADPSVTPAIAIYDQYADGIITYDAAAGQLRALSQAESPQIKAANACSTSFVAARDQVFAEYVDAYLAEHAEPLTELRQSLEDGLKQLDVVQPS